MRNSIESARLLRRKMGENSIRDFAKIYFPHYMSHPSPSFHQEIAKILIDMSYYRNARVAIAAPRGYAKSTIVNLFYVIWSICYSKEHFIVILSATARQAQGLLYGISKELQTNDLLLSDFPGIFSTEGKIKTKQTKDNIITSTDIRITALGAGQTLQGIKHNEYRPTLIILDDVDSAENTYGAQSRDNIFNWFTQAILKLGVLKGVNIIAIGTLIHTNSLLSRLTKKEEFPNWDSHIYKAVEKFSIREDLWQKWANILFSRGESYEGESGLAAADKFFQDNKKDMLESTKVLWEEQEDYYALMKIKYLETSYSFDSEKQNDPKNAKQCRYDPEKFYYWDDQFPTLERLIQSFDNEYSYIGACDPSVGENIDSDYSAIIILAKHKGNLYVIDADIARRFQEDLVQAIVNYCKIRHPMDSFAIEKNLCPVFLVETAKKLAYKENVIVPFKEIRINKGKELRIFGMETYITTGTIMFSRKQTTLLEQLKYFPIRDYHDDGPDALEMALREAEIGKVGFLPLNEENIRDKHGRPIWHPDFGRTTPEEDA